jgi:selenocysteine lyase/cysteine desulfurase
MPAFADGTVDVARVAAMIRPETALVARVHQPNVSGVVCRWPN